MQCGGDGIGMYIDITAVFTVDAHVRGVQMPNCTVLTFSFTYRLHHYKSQPIYVAEGKFSYESKWTRTACTRPCTRPGPAHRSPVRIPMVPKNEGRHRKYYLVWDGLMLKVYTMFVCGFSYYWLSYSDTVLSWSTTVSLFHQLCFHSCTFEYEYE